MAFCAILKSMQYLKDKFSPKIIIIGIVILNLLPLIAFMMSALSIKELLYIYWAEFVLIGLAALLLVFTKHIFILLILSVGATLLWLIADESAGIQDIKVPMAYWAFYSLGWLGYFEFSNSSMGHYLRRMHPMHQLGIYLAFMFLSIATCFSLTASLYGFWDKLPQVSAHIFHVFIIMSVTIPTLAIGVLKIIHMIGAQHFIHFMLGTYHRPLEKECVVLFLDMVGSTTIAEKLSPKDSMSLIAKIIFDASAIIHRYGGDILNFTGDGLVVIWPKTQANRAVSAVYGMRKRFEKIRPDYQEEFGMKPYFRMGLHAGKVVISQIGEQKLFLGLYGDTVNTAARMEQMNKELDTKVILSETVVDLLSDAWKPRLKSYGEQNIRGRENSLEVFTLNLPDER